MLRKGEKYPNLSLYSKALRCTFFGEWKNLCSSKFVQLELLNKTKARTQKKRAAKVFHYINLCISNFFETLFKDVHCQGPCSLRQWISRPYCMWLAYLTLRFLYIIGCSGPPCGWRRGVTRRRPMATGGRPAGSKKCRFFIHFGKEIELPAQTRNLTASWYPHTTIFPYKMLHHMLQHNTWP